MQLPRYADIYTHTHDRGDAEKFRFIKFASILYKDCFLPSLAILKGILNIIFF